jgi:hypothetical protein
MLVSEQTRAFFCFFVVYYATQNTAIIESSHPSSNSNLGTTQVQQLGSLKFPCAMKATGQERLADARCGT